MLRKNIALFLPLALTLASCKEAPEIGQDQENVALFCGSEAGKFILIDKASGEYYVDGTGYPIKKCINNVECMIYPFPFSYIKDKINSKEWQDSGAKFKILDRNYGSLTFLSSKIEDNGFIWKIEYSENSGIVNIYNLIDKSTYSKCAGNFMTSDLKKIHPKNLGPE